MAGRGHLGTGGDTPGPPPVLMEDRHALILRPYPYKFNRDCMNS